MKKLISVTIILLSSFIVKAQKVDSVRIIFDSLGNQTITVFENSTKPYTGKLNVKEVNRRISAVSNRAGFAEINDILFDTVDQINKEILEEERKEKLKKN